MSSNRVEHDRINVAQGGFTPSGYDNEQQSTTGWLTPNENDLTRWDANHVFLLSTFFTVSSNAKNRKTEIRDSRNQMTAGSGTKNIIALIPNVGEWEAACAEEGSLDVLFQKKPVRGRSEATQCTRIEREREAQRVISSLTKGNSYK